MLLVFLLGGAGFGLLLVDGLRLGGSLGGLLGALLLRTDHMEDQRIGFDVGLDALRHLKFGHGQTVADLELGHVDPDGVGQIVRAAQRYAQACVEGKCKPEDLSEAMLSDLMYSQNVPDPELVIRPGGELRTSNFLLWQSAYAEYYFTDVLWPEFGPEDLEKAIAAFNGRKRRFGGV